MKTLQRHITEKLVLNNNTKIRKQEYKYHPASRAELQKLLNELFKERNEEADLNDIDTSEITDMSKLFFYSNFNGDISKWDVSNVKDMNMMFSGCMFKGDISNWDVSKVTNMSKMFAFSFFNRDISKWNVNKKCKTTDIFRQCPIKEEYKPKFKK
jgi:surface protein